MLNPTSSAKKEEEFDESVINGPVTPFTQEALYASWDAYAQKMREAERDSLYSTLSSRKPEIKENNILLVKFDNQVQLIELQEERAEILGFLRNQLNNFAVQFDLIIEEQAQSTQLYTDTEKVKAMIEKNAVLSDLMKKFDLDVGF